MNILYRDINIVIFIPLKKEKYKLKKDLCKLFFCRFDHLRLEHSSLQVGFKDDSESDLHGEFKSQLLNINKVTKSSNSNQILSPKNIFL